MKDFIKAFLAGIIIVIAVVVYLSIENKIVGAFVFNIALVSIVVFDFNLYTGKIGYLLDNGVKYFKYIIILILGNLLGVITASYMFLGTRYANYLVEKARLLVDLKLSDNIISILILSIVCGILMYIGVHGFKTVKEEIGKYLIIILAIMTFVLIGVEHSIANTVYFTLAGGWSLQAFGYFCIMLIGNAIGAILMNTLFNLKEKGGIKNENINCK